MAFDFIKSTTMLERKEDDAENSVSCLTVKFLYMADLIRIPTTITIKS
jgi:hypothetical protein